MSSMTPFRLMIPFLLVAGSLQAQPFRWTRDQMIHFTPLNPFDRFADGRPKVPGELLEQIKKLTVAQVLPTLLAKGFVHQYMGPGFQALHPGKKLVGRAVTAQYLPTRPDLEPVLNADAKEFGLPASTNQKVIDLLDRDDVPVVDLMGAAPGHNFGGDNLQAAIYGATRTGAIVDGTIRDLEGNFEMPTQIYFRESHPAAVAGVNVIGINIPVKVGQAMVMPGDVVLGDRTGVIFIPPHLVKEVIAKAAK